MNSHIKLLEQIADQSQLVRQLQKEYLRTRTQSGLDRCRRAEQTLDVLIARRAKLLAEQKTATPQYVQTTLSHPNPKPEPDDLIAAEKSGQSDV